MSFSINNNYCASRQPNDNAIMKNKIYNIVVSQIRSQSEIIVMELCSGGSLFTLLENPANAYGFLEDDFKQVVKDVGEQFTHLYL